MPGLRLKLGCSYSDRIAALIDGRVRVEGAELNLLCLPPAELFTRALRNEEFDICEMSFSSFLMERTRGNNRFTAVPVFPSRMFRQAFVFVNADAGISEPRNLAGKRVGVLDYPMTAAVTIRGFLADDFGVRPQEIDWIQGGQDTPVGIDTGLEWTPPPGVSITPAPAGRTLSDMLEAGDIDALAAAWAPNCFSRGSPRVRRLFADSAAVEADYYRRTGIFPIMHVLVGRTALFTANPWLSAHLVAAFTEAKNLAYERLTPHTSHFFFSLPWGHLELERTRTLMGEDFWPYGMAANHAALTALVRWSYEQGLSPRPASLAELFWPSALT